MIKEFDFSKRVEGKSEEGFGDISEEEKKKKEEQTAMLEKYRTETQALVDSYRRFFVTFARDVSLSFRISNKFAIDLENGVIHNDARWLADKNCTKEQIIWAHLHELNHFVDLSKDPEGTKKHFEYIWKKSKETGAILLKKWEGAFGESDPEFIAKIKEQKPASRKDPKITSSPVEDVGYKLHHTFWNVFDDIYVNNLVSRRASRYEKEEAGGKEVENLYKEKLFKGTDYSQVPRYLQFLYKLLREEMVPGEEVILSPEVQAVMETKISLGHHKLTPKEIVENFVKPKFGRDTKKSQRDLILKKTLEPIFNKLLLKDIEEWIPRKPDPRLPLNHILIPHAEDYENFEQNNFDQIDDNEIEDWIDNKEEDDKKREDEKREEGKSAAVRAVEAQGVMDKEWCRRNGIVYQTFLNFQRTKDSLKTYSAELSKLWRRIVYGSERQIIREMKGYHKVGTEMDMSKVIEEWPKIDKGDIDKVRVMKRSELKETLVEKPELIRVRFLGDNSGSMQVGAKNIFLEKCFVMAMASLREFNTYLNLSRSQTKSKLQVDSEGWTFGVKENKIKKLRSEVGLDREMVEIVKLYQSLTAKEDETCDHMPLRAILNSYTKEDRQKIATGKIMEIIIEVTDGGSSKADLTRTAVDKLEKMGVIVRAFQIGDASEFEQLTFSSVWNDGRAQKLGQVVPDVAQLIPAIAEALKEYLSKVRL